MVLKCVQSMQAFGQNQNNNRHYNRGNKIFKNNHLNKPNNNKNNSGNIPMPNTSSLD